MSLLQTLRNVACRKSELPRAACTFMKEEFPKGPHPSQKTCEMVAAFATTVPLYDDSVRRLFLKAYENARATNATELKPEHIKGPIDDATKEYEYWKRAAPTCPRDQ